MPKKQPKKPGRSFGLLDTPTITVVLSPAEIIAARNAHESAIRRLPKAYGEALRDLTKPTQRDLATMQKTFKEYLAQHAERVRELNSKIPD